MPPRVLSSVGVGAELAKWPRSTSTMMRANIPTANKRFISRHILREPRKVLSSIMVERDLVNCDEEKDLFEAGHYVSNPTEWK